VGGRTTGKSGIVAASLLAALSLAGCQPWDCDFDSRGACVEFKTDPPDMHAARLRMDRLLEIEFAFWGLANLDGWRIQFRDSASYPCYFADRNDGCTDYLEHTISVRLPPDGPGCFEAAELLHELGHYELGDPMHSNGRWAELDAQFAGIVWDRPDAAPECVERYAGITSGVWQVTRHGF
jgi:hypothetical protein